MSGDRWRLSVSRAGLCLAALAGAGLRGDDGGGWIQQALDRTPGQMVFVPAGDHLISEAIRIRSDHSGLWGPGRIVQANPAAAILEAAGVADVQIRGLRLARAAGRETTRREGILIAKCADVLLADLEIVDNRSSAGAVTARDSRDVRIRDCRIENYSRISIDDRGMAAGIGGTGIRISGCQGTVIEGNRVIERANPPAPELSRHPGSAIGIAGSATDDDVQLLGNFIENAAQGVDLRADHVILAGNIVDRACAGLTATNGSRNVIVAENQFSQDDLWSIGLMPGTASHGAEPAAGGHPAREANVDGHSIVADNIVSDFGYGNAQGIPDGGHGSPILLDAKPEGAAAPVLQGVILEANLVYDTGRDGVVVDGRTRIEAPRYRQAIRIADSERGPRGLRLADNLLDPGTAPYPDDRPVPAFRMPARDAGVVLRHGDGPDGCDVRGAREAVVYREHGLYHLFYDGAGRQGWRACLATSPDLVHWEKQGPILELGAPGRPDAAAATSPWAIEAGGTWHMFYLGTPNASPMPDFVPHFPYLTLAASAPALAGPWTKNYRLIPFSPRAGSWTASTASPGYIVEDRGEFLQFLSGSSQTPDTRVKRTLGLARTSDLDSPWHLDAEPLFPPGEQVENSSVYYEPANGWWFLFTNHIGCELGETERLREFTDAIWVYWSRDPRRWDERRKAVVLDGSNCIWSHRCIGMPAVIARGGRLAVLYDGPGGDSTSHMQRDIGLAWLDLPLQPPDHGRAP